MYTYYFLVYLLTIKCACGGYDCVVELAPPYVGDWNVCAAIW
jgi:hypothetical protein